MVAKAVEEGRKKLTEKKEGDDSAEIKDAEPKDEEIKEKYSDYEIDDDDKKVTGVKSIEHQETTEENSESEPKEESAQKEEAVAETTES